LLNYNMDDVKIIDNFFQPNILDKIINKINNALWETRCINRNYKYFFSEDRSFWKINLTDDLFFNGELINLIETILNKKFEICKNVYAISLNYGCDGIYHIDDIESGCNTFCLYINNTNQTNNGGDFYIKSLLQNHIICIENLMNRGILFNSSLYHKGSCYDRIENDLRICISWKFKEIK